MNNNIFSKDDYLKRNVEKDTLGQTEYSPMDPPDAYKPPGMDPIPYHQLPLFLQHISDEHKIILEQLKEFENTLIATRKEGVTKDRNREFSRFFEFLDDTIVLHHLKEERLLFGLLHNRLLEAGERSNGAIPVTAIDMLESDHIKIMQLAALAFNLMGISSRLTDMPSQAMLLDTAIEQGNQLIEIFRLHIFREDNVVFSLACKYLTTDEFETMKNDLKKNFSIVLAQ